MSASVGQVQRPRERSLAAEKARRQKIILIAAFALLAVVLVIQLPKTLKLISGSSSSGTTSPPAVAVTPTVAPAPVVTQATPSTRKVSPELRALLTQAGGDPFQSRGIAVGGLDRAPADVRTPGGVHDPFVSHGAFDGDSSPRAVASPAGLRDPFLRPGSRAASASAAAPGNVIVVGTRGHGRARVGWIVVLASIPLNEGRQAAARFAEQARADGIRGVGILNSSGRKPLRHGYWVVYLGSYRSISVAERVASVVHAVVGYGGSYVRQLVRYG